MKLLIAAAIFLILLTLIVVQGRLVQSVRYQDLVEAQAANREMIEEAHERLDLLSERMWEQFERPRIEGKRRESNGL